MILVIQISSAWVICSFAWQDSASSLLWDYMLFWIPFKWYKELINCEGIKKSGKYIAASDQYQVLWGLPPPPVMVNILFGVLSNKRAVRHFYFWNITLLFYDENTHTHTHTHFFPGKSQVGAWQIGFICLFLTLVQCHVRLNSRHVLGYCNIEFMKCIQMSNKKRETSITLQNFTSNFYCNTYVTCCLRHFNCICFRIHSLCFLSSWMDVCQKRLHDKTECNFLEKNRGKCPH